MVVSPRIFALPWYARADYPTLLRLFSDPDKLPATYDGWLKHAELVERQFQKAGFGVARSGSGPSPLRPGARSGTSRPIKRRA
jgi:hypothetical protein